MHNKGVHQQLHFCLLLNVATHIGAPCNTADIEVGYTFCKMCHKIVRSVTAAYLLVVDKTFGGQSKRVTDTADAIIVSAFPHA